jgi:Tol biopolymer transport system component
MRFIAFLSVIILTSSCSHNQSEKIIFQSKDNGLAGIFLMESPEDMTLLSQADSKAVSPLLSPTKDKLAYLSEENGNWDIWIYDLKTKENTNLTESEDMDGSPAWSPDGKRMAYMSMKNKNRDIYVYDFENKTIHQATFNPSIDLDPIWSESQPNNIYFKSIREGYEAIYQLNMTDSLSGMISVPGGNSSKAEIVPTQNKVSYVRFYDGKYTLMLFDEASRTTTDILVSEKPIRTYAWSKQGDHVALDIDGMVQVYVLGQDKAVLRDNIPNAEFPIWGHSGLSLYYNLNDDKGAQVFKYNLLDETVTSVTPSSVNAYNALPIQ